MSFRYIGSKSRLVEPIRDLIGSFNGKGVFIDAFCGTGAVAKVASKLGWPVQVNDQLISGGIMASSQLISNDDVNFESLGGYKSVIVLLNSLEPVKGFFWKEYSPASKLFIEHERRYFKEDNAQKIDAIIKKIKDWKQEAILTENELILIKSDLIRAVNRVANIAGTYGCFLAKWTKQSDLPLILNEQDLCDKKSEFTYSTENVFDLIVQPDDLVYLDPPYTKRQYASYYHILETLVHLDEPSVEGVCGLRPWKEKSSEFCYKRKAFPAIIRLVKGLNSKKILLSYSSEGHVAIEDLLEGLSALGKVEAIPLQMIGRYRPNKKASSNNSSVNEFLLVIEKNNINEVVA